MAKTSNVIVGLIAFLVITVLLVGGLGVYYMAKQQTALERREAEVVPPALVGKSVTLSAVAYDQAADSPSSTQAVAPLYVILEPTEVTDTKVKGNGFAADGTSLSSSARTDVTSGLKVGNKIIAIAVNKTVSAGTGYYGVWSDVKELDGQQVLLDLDVYKVAASGGQITLRDKDENTIDIGGGDVNLTLGASETEQFDYLRIENNNTNAAWNVVGFFIDKASGTNLTGFSIGASSKTEGTYEIGLAETDKGLERTDADDEVFEFAEPIMLLEYDYIKVTDLQVKADGDGCASTTGEAFTIYIVDGTWFKSSKENAMIFDWEDDSDSPSDVGASDLSATYYCTA